MRRTISAGLFLAVICAGSVVMGQAVVWHPAALFGGDIRSLAISPTDPDLVLAGTATGEVFLSLDGGATWDRPGDPLPLDGWVVSDLVFDPQVEQRVWAALWGIWGGGTVAFSDDFGAHWTQRAEGLPGSQVYTIALSTVDRERLYAATRGGVYGSTDGGSSWSHLTGSHPEIQKVSSLLLDPERPDTVYAGTWRRAYRSEDGGRTWTGIFDGMLLDSEVFTLNWIPDRPGELWASTCGWVYRGSGRGSLWKRHQEGFEERRTPSFLVGAGGRLFAGTVAGLHVSENGGANWERRTPGSLAVLDIAQHPDRPERILLATEGAGVWWSLDGGATFESTSVGMSAQRVSQLTRSGDEVLVAVRAAGPRTGVYRSSDGGRSFQMASKPIGDVLSLVSGGGSTLAGTEHGLYMWQEGSWAEIPGLEGLRVEKVSYGLGGWVAIADGSVYWAREGVFEPVEFRHGRARDALASAGKLWVFNGEGLFALTATTNDRIDLPAGVDELTIVGEDLLVAGRGGVWIRSKDGQGWGQLDTSPARVLTTGDESFPLLILPSEEKVGRVFGHDLKSSLEIVLPVPEASVTDAIVKGGTLVIATSGSGTFFAELVVSAERLLD